MECENEVKEILEENKCNHPFVSKSNQLLPLSLGFCLVEHLPEKNISYEKYKKQKENGSYRKISQLVYFEGEKCVQEFFDYLENLEKKLIESEELPPDQKLFESRKLPPKKLPEEIKEFNNASNCYLCNIKFNNKNIKMF